MKYRLIAIDPADPSKGYGIYELKNPKAEDLEFNRKFIFGVFKDKAKAEALVDKWNRKEEEKRNERQ